MREPCGWEEIGPPCACRAKAKYGPGHADNVLLAEHPSLHQLAETPLGEKADLLVIGTADDGQVQVPDLALAQIKALERAAVPKAQS